MQGYLTIWEEKGNIYIYREREKIVAVYSVHLVSDKSAKTISSVIGQIRRRWFGTLRKTIWLAADYSRGRRVMSRDPVSPVQVCRSTGRVYISYSFLLSTSEWKLCRKVCRVLYWDLYSSIPYSAYTIAYSAYPVNTKHNQTLVIISVKVTSDNKWLECF